MPSKIVLDHIIHHLQTKGGISRVWVQIENSIQFNQRMDIAKHRPRLLLLRRYLPVCLFGFWRKHVFLSSYYRVSLNPKSFNVVIVHDLIYELYNKRNLGTVLHLLQRRIALKLADKIICVSKNTKNDLLNYYSTLNSCKVTVIPNGVDALFLDDSTATAINNIPLTFFLYVGSRGACKNFGMVAQFLRLNPSLYCVAVTSPLSVSETLEYADVIDRLKLVSDIDDLQLKFLYQSATFLLMPSTYEGFGLPIIEAFACHCPVILPPEHCFPEVAGELGIYFDGRLPNSIQQAITDAQQMSGAQKEKLKEHAKTFAWPQIIQRYDEALSY